MSCSSLHKARSRAERCKAGSRRDVYHRRGVLALLPLLATAPAQAVTLAPEPFLKSTGARGFLAEEEEAVLTRRKEAESAVRTQLDREREEFEAAARKEQRGLYASSISGFFMRDWLHIVSTDLHHRF